MGDHRRRVAQAGRTRDSGGIPIGRVEYRGARASATLHRLVAALPNLRHSRRIAVVPSAVAVVVAGVVGLASPFVVDHASMATTLQPGAVLLVSRLPVTSLSRGDVVVFRPPVPGYTGEPFVKRVIGLPGELVEIRSGRVFIDGHVLAEPYVYGDEPTTTSEATFAVRVPAHSVFVLGDHRDSSWDSREYGPVPVANIVGQAWVALGTVTPVEPLTPPAY